MYKVTISWIILAACINFRTAQADLYNPLDSILSNRHNIIPNNVEQVTETVNNAITQGSKSLLGNLGKGVIKLGSGIISNIPLPLATEVPKLKNENESSVTEVPSSEVTVCTKTQNDGRAILNQFVFICKTCISKETQSIGVDIQKLLHLAELQNIKDIINCAKQLNPLRSVPCLLTSAPKIIPEIRQGIEAIFKLINLRTTLVPHLGMCFVSYFPNILQNISKLLIDGEKCFESVLLKVL